MNQFLFEKPVRQRQLDFCVKMRTKRKKVFTLFLREKRNRKLLPVFNDFNGQNSTNQTEIRKFKSKKS
jgi:hypothetical protein